MPPADRTTEPARGPKTLCIPGSQPQHEQIVGDPALFREFLDRRIEAMPAPFPPEIRRGYRMKDSSTSRKMGWKLRRIDLRNGNGDAARTETGTERKRGTETGTQLVLATSE